MLNLLVTEVILVLVVFREMPLTYQISSILDRKPRAIKGMNFRIIDAVLYIGEQLF